MEFFGLLLVLVVVGTGIAVVIGGPKLAKYYLKSVARLVLWCVGLVLRLAGWIVGRMMGGVAEWLSKALCDAGKSLPKLVGGKTK